MVVIHVTGALTLTVQPGYSPLNNRVIASADTSLAGSKAPGYGIGWSNQYFRVSLIYATSGYTPSLVSDPAISDGARTDTLWVAKGEDLLVSRTTIGSQMSCWRLYAGERPCGTPQGPDSAYTVASYKISGSQTVFVERLDDRISLTASPSTGGKGRNVTFTPQIPAWDGPVDVATWTWIPDSGAVQGVACYTATPCVKTVNESGTMKLTVGFKAHAAVPKLTRAASAHVTAVDCPTGDSVLDTPGVRDSLKALIQRSYNADSTKVLEYAGWILQDSSGTFYFLPDQWASHTDCAVDVDPSDVPSDPVTHRRAIAHVHSHPTYPGHSAAGCLDEDGKPFNEWMITDAKANGGGSAADWRMADSVLHMPEYVIAIHGEVFRLDPGYSQTHNANDNPNRWWWKRPNGSGCQW